jgi:polyphosphate kinase 2 (PPK2 family)
MLADDDTLILKFWFGRNGEKRGRHGRVFDEARKATDSDEVPWRLIEHGKSRKSQVAMARTIILFLSARLASTSEPRGPVKAKTLSAPPPSTVLDAVDLTKHYEKAEYQQKLDRWRDELRKVSRLAQREGVATVLAFEGWDAAGKGGVIRRLSAGLDPPSYRVVSVAAPSDEDLAHHYLWRFWQHLPSAGRMTIFDRSWYGRVLVERVEGLAREDEWRRAYDEINEFETGLVESGVLLLKFWLHIDPEEQLRRFREREQIPYKNYKITADDYRNRERWNDYLAAVDEMASRTSRDVAPWEIVPANDKRWARVRVIKTVCKQLRRRLS